MDLIVKEQFTNACSEELAVYLLEIGPKDLVELTTWAQQYLITHKQQFGGKTKSTVQPKRAEQGKPTQPKLDTTPGRQRSKSGKARIRRVHRLLAKVTRRRPVQW